MTNEIKQRIEQINRGEVPEGYKKTEVGIVPQEWESGHNLGDLFDFYGGLGIPRDQLSAVGIPYLHYGDMHRDYFTKASYDKYEKLPKYDALLKGDETYLIKDGDMVFLDASEDLSGTSRCVVIDNPENHPFISGLHTFAAKPKKNVLNKEYKQYLTTPQGVQRQFERLASGFKVYGLNRNTVKQISIAYPKSLDEQQRIAEILSKWDEAIELQEKLIKKLEEQKKALMQKLLTPKDGWKEIKIADVFKSTRGYVLPVEKCSHEYKFPVYSSQTKNNGLMGFYNKYLYENAITWTTDGANAGKVLYRQGKFYCTNVCGVLLNDEGYANPCLAYLLNIITPKYVSYVGNPKLMNNVMGSIKMKIPSLKYQIKISEIINILYKHIDLEALKLQKLKQQQKSMQQLLLTGIVRV